MRLAIFMAPQPWVAPSAPEPYSSSCHSKRARKSPSNNPHSQYAPTLRKVAGEKSPLRSLSRSVPTRARSGRGFRLVVFHVFEVAGEVGLLTGAEGLVGPLLVGDRTLAIGTDWFWMSLFPHGRTPDRCLGLHGVWTPYHICGGRAGASPPCEYR